MTALHGLAASAREHIELLRSVHLCERDLYYPGNDLFRAIAAYVNWLPQLNDGTHESLVELPSLDVAWIWHLHKADPASYQRDCTRWYGHLLDAPIGVSPFLHSSSLSTESTPPKVDKCDECPKVDCDFLERIISSAKNQSSFLWHINWPEYEDSAFLEESVDRYEKMLHLMKKHPNQFIVPTYDIENIWRTHLAFPSRYIEDCRRLVGREINHNDDCGSFLSISCTQTELLWNDTFVSPWKKNGAMFRGDPPSWYWGDRLRAATRPGPLSPPTSDRTAEPAIGLIAHYAVQVVGRAFGTEENGVVRPVLVRDTGYADTIVRALMNIVIMICPSPTFST
jgi:hypothetical protein